MLKLGKCYCLVVFPLFPLSAHYLICQRLLSYRLARARYGKSSRTKVLDMGLYAGDRPLGAYVGPGCAQPRVPHRKGN